MPIASAADSPSAATTGAPPMLPIVIAAAMPPENSENADPRSASLERRDSSTVIGVITIAPPAPPISPDTMSSGVVSGSRSIPIATKVIPAPVRMRLRDETRSTSQPVGRRIRKIAMPSAAK